MTTLAADARRRSTSARRYISDVFAIRMETIGVDRRHGRDPGDASACPTATGTRIASRCERPSPPRRRRREEAVYERQARSSSSPETRTSSRPTLAKFGEVTVVDPEKEFKTMRTRSAGVEVSAPRREGREAASATKAARGRRPACPRRVGGAQRSVGASPTATRRQAEEGRRRAAHAREGAHHEEDGRRPQQAGHGEDGRPKRSNPVGPVTGERHPLPARARPSSRSGRPDRQGGHHRCARRRDATRRSAPTSSSR